ncbi:MAG: ribosome biogenesis GTPase Der [Candidatus Marinimicrobia bacterium]|jgi:GTP-binding protein|nr:ribosome biogenesis GTPase Der [Candidatus Neomarinimicrobiota bacterium]|tara:strand:- start:1469 stop:2785 length:1317 start_codon:yes stop_codon:yes gene_type:complete
MAKKPKIAIVGRPNVGKSTLFNKLSGKRTSIVDQMEGVTRDRVYSSAEWLSQEFNIIDTGGYVSSNEDVFNEKIKEQISAALNECDGIIFLVDGKDGLNPNDQFLSKFVRKSGKKFVMGVNKCDTPEHHSRKDQFFDIGFENPIPISALNGAGVGDMLDNLFESIDFNKIAQSSDNTDCSITIVGMPNVGKSSLLNALIQRDQAIVSDIAGTTRDSVDTIIKWHGKDIKIVDTAGLRKKSKVDSDIEFYSSLRAMDSLLRSDLVLLVVDAEKGFTKQEKTIAKEVIKKGKRMAILVNKWDLASGKDVSAELYKEDMYMEFKDLQHYPILFVSALTKRRVSNILEVAWEVFTKQREKLSTKELNIWIEKAVRNYPPPAAQGKSIKIKFVEQVQQSPPIFALFSNYPKLISIQYLRYLHNQLRESFDLNGITIKFSLRKG